MCASWTLAPRHAVVVLCFAHYCSKECQRAGQHGQAAIGQFAGPVTSMRSDNEVYCGTTEDVA